MKAFLFLLISFFNALLAGGQILFNQDYHYLEGGSIVEIENGSYLFTGTDTSGQINVTKIDQWGDVVWSQNYGFDFAKAITRVNNNEYLVTGTTNPHQAFILAIDSGGTATTINVNTSVGMYFEEYTARKTLDGNFILLARDTFPTLIKFDVSGNVIWAKKYPAIEISYSFIEMPDSGFILVGDSSYNFTLALSRTNSVGDVQWTKYFPKPYGSHGYAINTCSGGGYVVNASFYSGIPDDPDQTWLLRFDAADDTLWTVSMYGEYDNSYSYHIQQCHDNGFITVRDIWDFVNLGHDTRVMKLDTQGALVWSARFKGWVSAFHNCIQETSDHGYIFMCADYFYGSKVVRFDSLGNYVLSVAESNYEGVSVFPNPSSETVIIQNSEILPGSISMYTVSGNKVNDFNFSLNGKTEIDISELLSGVYILVYQSGELIVRQKIIKQ